MTETPEPAPTRNAALFDKVAAAIEETPDRYAQTTWAGFVPDGSTTRPVHTALAATGRHAAEPACGTALCVAGWAVELTEGTKAVRQGGVWVLLPRTFPDEVDESGVGVWAERARIALGLSVEDAEALFDAGWSWQEPAGVVADRLRAIGRGADPAVWL